MTNRRKFLMGAGALAAATLLPRRPAHADLEDYTLPGGPRKILEIFLYGALSPWESFYVHPSFFTTAQGDAYRDTALVAPCTGTGGTAPTYVSAPEGVSWSVATAPLWSRPDILARTRVVTMTHEFNVHAVGIPVALTGRPPGNSLATSVGAAIKRRHPGQNTSFILMPTADRFANGGDYAAFNAWLAVGGLGSAARPVVLPMSMSFTALSTWARRLNVRPGTDPLSQHYATTYRAALGGARASGADDYEAALAALPGSPQLIDTFNMTQRRPGDATSHCASHPSFPESGISRLDTTDVSLQLAVRLFNERGARYVGMVDVGLGTDTNAAYDGHGHSAGVTFGNLAHLLSKLAPILTSGTPSATQLGLEDVMVVLNTEFGRTPVPQGIYGRNHFSTGYVTVLLGGPIQATSSGRPKLIGDLGTMTAAVTGTYEPKELSCVILAAAGIEPENPLLFAAPDLPNIAEFFAA